MATSPFCTYLVPFRRNVFRGKEAAELYSYFEMLVIAGCEVLIIDGSPPSIFHRNENVFGQLCRHAPVDPRFGYLNDKVNGIHTGVRLASSEKIILADDDIRYTAADVKRMMQLLDTVEVVRPQNYLSPLPWWGKMEMARMLINRALLRAADYPGTCAFRRRTMLAVGPYDGDVLFDNEELIRHFAQHRRIIAYATEFLIQKSPPTFHKWLEQRPRQAYEDFSMQAKTAFFFSLPICFLLVGRLLGAGGLRITAVLISLAAILLAFSGRARDNGRRFFPARCCFLAPLWLAERALSTYVALYWYLRYGGYPFGDRLLRKGVGRAWRFAMVAAK